MSVLKKLSFQKTISACGRDFQIRSVEPRDIETLRVWKNKNREFFHFKKIISPHAQIEWFQIFSAKPDRDLLICEHEGELVACVGFRENDAQTVELFNLICGKDELLGTGVVKEFVYHCFRVLSDSYAFVNLEVLKSNARAVNWYIRQGFRKEHEAETYYNLKLDLIYFNCNTLTATETTGGGESLLISQY